MFVREVEEYEDHECARKGGKKGRGGICESKIGGSVISRPEFPPFPDSRSLLVFFHPPLTHDLSIAFVPSRKIGNLEKPTCRIIEIPRRQCIAFEIFAANFLVNYMFIDIRSNGASSLIPR